jgi:predicted ATP-grasp superfamily ATP-dependent carboligase
MDKAGMTKPPLLVHDLQDSQMFALAQAAGRAGIAVEGTRKVAAPWAQASRYVERTVSMPSLSDAGAAAYAFALRQSGLRGVWLPGVDDTVLFTARYRALLEKAGMHFLVADAETQERAHDFWRLPKVAGLAMPFGGQFHLREIADSLREYAYPLMVKNARGDYRCIDNADALAIYLERMSEEEGADALLAMQGYIPGPVERMATAMLLFDAESRPVRGFTGRRLRVAPTVHGAFGETTAARSEWIPELYDGAVELLSELGWKGFAEVECKQGEDGRWQVMEMNRRLSGWTYLAEKDGVDMLAAYHRICADGVRLDEACPQRSRAGYVRMIATRDHDPDWGVATVADDSRLRRLRRLIGALWLEWRRPDEISLGAWDRRDLRASLLLFGATVRRLWRLWRGRPVF